MQNPSDANIPVLTEVIDLPPAEAAHPAEAFSGDGSDDAAETTAPPRLISEADWLALEQQIKENVLKQVLTRVDFVLEHRVRDTLADVLQTAVESLAQDIRAGLKNSLEDVVTRALSQEIAKIKTPR